MNEMLLSKIRLPQNPIFITGYPRSGTTLVQRLLATQPEIVSFPETHYFERIEKQVQKDENGCIAPPCLDRVFAEVTEKMGFQFTAAERSMLCRLAEQGELSSKKLFECAVTHFLAALYPERDFCRQQFRWIEKTPHHAMFMDRIITLYPAAQILHILRHPVPAILSRKNKFPFNRETPLEQMARGWNRMQERVEQFRLMYRGQIHVMRYEDLMADMENMLQAASAFLNISFDFSLLQGMREQEDARRFILAKETWKQGDVERDIASTNDAYKESASRDQVAAIEAIVMKTMRRCGYRPYLAEL